MKQLLTSITLLMLCFTASAQKFSYQQMDGDKTYLYNRLINTKNGFLQFEVELNKKIVILPGGFNKIKHGLKVNKLDATLKETASKSLFNDEHKLVPWLYSIFEFNNKPYILYHNIVNDEQAGGVNIVSVDEESLQEKDEKTLLDFTSKGITFDAKKVIKNQESTYEYYISENKKRLMLTTEPRYEGGENKKIYVLVYDENFNKVMEKTIDFKIPHEKISLYNTICDNSGNVYIAYREFYDVDKKGYILNKDGERCKPGEVQDDMKKLLIAQPGKEQINTVDLKLEGYSIFQLAMTYSPLQNKVLIMGPFCEAWNANLIGVFHAAVDAHTMQSTVFTPVKFPEALIEKVADDGFAKTKEKKYGLLRNYSSEIVLRGDGTADALLRFMQMESYSTTSSSGVTRNTTNFYGGDFVDAHLVGDSIRFTAIPYDMVSPQTDIYLASTTFSNDDKLIVIYNDNEKNINREISDGAKKGVVQKSEVCGATIDRNGVVTRQRLLPDLDGKSIATLTRIFRIDNNSFFILLNKLNFMSMSTANLKYIKVMVN